MFRRAFSIALTAAAVLFVLGGTASAQSSSEHAICYNCPPEWADWGGMLKAIQKNTGIAIPPDDKNSGQALAELIAEKAHPIADFTYLGVSFAIEAKAEGVLQPFKPTNWDQVPPDLKDPAGYWFATHYGTIGLFVNKAALEGKPVPRSWADLLKPEYRGMVGVLDPTSAFVGYAAAVAINKAFGGTFKNWAPGITYFRKLLKNHPVTPKQTSYALVVSGEIPIMIDFDFNAYRAEYKDHAPCVFVIPKEGTIVVPYVLAMVKGAPQRENAEKALDFIQSAKGQAIWAEAFLHPVLGTIPAAIAKEFLPQSDYQRAHTVNYQEMAAAEKGFTQLYLREIR